MIGKRAEKVLNRAVRIAFDHRNEYFTLEHVLVSLLEEDSIVAILNGVGADAQRLRNELAEYIEKEIPKYSPKDEEVEHHPLATLAIQRLIQRALFHVQSAGKDEIQIEDLFVAFFGSKDSFALHQLKKQNIERLDVINFISHGLSPEISEDEPTSEESEESESRDLTKNSGESSNAKRSTLDRGARKPNSKEPADDVLQEFAILLNTQAEKGKIDPIVGREKELERVIQVLCRRRKNNPLLVGEAGVGKTAIAEGLALRIVQKAVPNLLLKGEVYAIDMGTMLAGTKYRGDFEQRLKRVLQALKARQDKGYFPIVFIDEIHTVVGAGSVSGGSMDAANLLKPILTRGELRFLGSTTYNEYRTVIDKDHALSRRFQKIDVPEPTRDEAIQILAGLKSQFENHHQVEYMNDAIRASVDLSIKHMPDRFLPDKAIDIMDEVGSRTRLRQEATSEREKITASDIEEVVALIARIPARSVTVDQKVQLKKLDTDLKLAIFGQDEAVQKVVNAIRLARSGLRTGDKPVGSFLFCGPTGVGKTELSKQLAHALGVPFLRFDMSEYMEKHTVSRLIGAPPGYVGFEQAGLLTDAMSKSPYSVVLLDEIEKAHPDVWNILLQVMDHGFLTDNNGKKADFRNAILILTSNVGSREMDRRPLGMAGESAAQDLLMSGAQREVEKAFSPEFRNRLDSVIYFQPLGPVTIAQVVGKQIAELEAQLLAKGVDLEVSAEAREWLAHKGYDKRMGARPMARLIQEEIKKKLAEEILFGALEHGGKVTIVLKDEKIDLVVIPRKVEVPLIGTISEG